MATIEQFLNDFEGPIIDVRSPCEFASGHIPLSFSLPLFTDEERACVGTTYTHQGHDAAVVTGLQAVGPKLGEMALSLRKIIGDSQRISCRITCFRGGMRSRSVQWLCEFLGFSTVRLGGGYKAYRRYVLETFARPYHFIVIGGRTGSGKTEWINVLKERGHQAIDLEALARHRGSAFGLLPEVVQPRTEQFENVLAHQLWAMNPSRPIFIEDESPMIGTVVIPKALYDQMDRSEAWWLDVGVEERLNHLLSAYGSLPLPWLIACTQKLSKRLGGERVRTITDFLNTGRLREAAQLLLEYYDQTYLHSCSRHTRKQTVMTRDQMLQESLSQDWRD